MYKRFQMLLEENDISAYKVSQETGVDRTTLSNWKNEKYIPKMNKLKKIADYFGVSAEWLHGDSDNRIPYGFQIETSSADSSVNVNLSPENIQNLPKYLESALQLLKQQDTLLLHDRVLDKTSKELIELDLQYSIDMINAIFEKILS